MSRVGVAYVEITGDLTRLNRAIAQVDAKLKRVSQMQGEGKLDLDTKAFDLAYKEGVAKLARLERKKARAVLQLDTHGIAVAEREIAVLQHQLEHLRGEVKIDIDRSALSHLRSLLTGGTGGSGGIFGGLLGVSAYKDRFAIFAVAAASLAGALNAVASAALAVGAGLAPLAGLLAAIPGAISGVAQAGGALFATFSGIGDAVKAMGDASTKSAVDDTAALERQRSATEAVRGAKLALTNSQRQAQSAQEALTQARKDATRTLADMKDQAKSAATVEAGSVIALRRAQSELQKITADPKSSQLDIEEAQQGVRVARDAAREARIEAARAKRDSDRAQAGGVDKTPQVVSAREQLAEANRNVTESTRQLTRAQEQAAQGTNQVSSSQQKLKEQMDKLSPAGQRFVRFLHDLKPAFRSIRNASQEAALPHFQKGIEGAMKNLPVFRQALTNTSRVLGVASENFGKFLGSKSFGRDFEKIGRTNNNVMRNLGRAMIPLGKAFADISVAAGPFTRWLGRAVLHLARLIAHSAKAGRESGGLAKFLHRTRNVLETIGRTIGNLVHGLGGLFKEAFPEGLGFLKLMERLSDKFDDWANSAKGRNDIRDFFERSKGPLKDLGSSLGSIVRMVRDLLAAPGSGAGFQLFARAVGLLADSIAFLARIPGVGGAVANLALIAVVAGRYGKLGAFAKGLSEIAGGLRGVTAAEGAGTGLRGFGLRIRTMLSGLAKTRVGETIAGNISAGLGVGAIKFRRALDGFKRIMSRVLGSAGISAGTSAAEGAAGQLGASGGLFRRSGGRLGRIFGRTFAVGVLAGIVLLGVWLNKKILTDWRDPIHETGRKIGEALVNGIIKSVNFGVGLLNKVLPKKLELGKVGEVDLRDWEEPMKKAPRAPTFQRDGKTFARDRQGRVRRVHEDEQELRGPSRASTPTRTKTVEIQTPVLSLKAKDVERSMDRIQTVLRRELGQARRLIERQVDGWQDVFKGFRLLRGDDPLHLGSGIKRSAEDGRKALRGIVESLGRILERLSVLFRIEGREAMRELVRGFEGRDVVSRVARMRAEVVQELGKMKRQGSEEAREMVANLRDTFTRLPEVVSRSTGEMLRIVLTAMRALGATGRGRIVAAVDKIEGKAMGGVLPGYSRTDDTLIMARSGEAILTPEQHQPEVNAALGFAKFMGVGRFGSLGEMFQRTGAYAKGGEVQGFAKGGNVRGIVPIPGQPGESIHSSIVGQVVSLMRRYKGRVTDGYAPSGHKAGGEHPKGLAVDVVPGDGGSWGRIDKLAAWAEPTQGSPRAPFRWVGYTGDAGHGRPGETDTPHLHLSWGGDGGSVEMTPRVRAKVKGARGAVRDVVGAAVEKVKGASNRKLRQAEGVLSTSGAVGKGGPLGRPSANMKLGRQLMARVFRPDQWSALRTLWQGESGWKTTADNPTSSAYGIPQALPGSKMRSAGKDWETNPATQIKWGLRYIKERYGTPSKALAAWRGRSPHWYAKGGFVKGFARGGVVKHIAKQVGATPPPGAKRPSRKKSGRGKDDTIRLRRFRPGRVGDYVGPSLLSGFENIWDWDIPFLQEDYDEFKEDADVVQEEFLVSPSGGGAETVDWAAVRIRISELTGLLSRAAAIQAKVLEARRLAVAMVEELKAVAREQLKRVAAIYKRIRENIDALSRLRKALKNERKKKGKNRDQGSINYIENLIDAIHRQNQELGGTRDELPSNWRAMEGGSALGKIATVVTTVSDALSPDGEGPGGKLIEIQGRTGRGGTLDEIGNTIREWTQEKLDLQPGGKLVTSAAGTGADQGISIAQDQRAFIAQISGLLKDYGSNFRPLKFQRGGIIPGLGFGDKIPVLAEPGEGFINRRAVEAMGGSPMIEYINKIAPRFASGGVVQPVTVDPRTGELKIKMEQEQDQRPNVTQNITFQTQPKEMHGFTRSALHELEAAV